MHASVSTLQIQPGKMDQAIEILQEFVPEVRQIQGVRGSQLLIDRQTNEATTVTLYETEADIQATETSGKYQELVDRLTGVLAGRPTRKIYEVSLRL